MLDRSINLKQLKRVFFLSFSLSPFFSFFFSFIERWIQPETFFPVLPIWDYTQRVPYSVNNAAEGRHSTNTTRIRTLASTLARKKPPTNSGDFRASYLSSGFGVTRLLATLYPSYAPHLTPSPLLFSARVTRLAPFISDLPERQWKSL